MRSVKFITFSVLERKLSIKIIVMIQNLEKYWEALKLIV